MTSQMAEEIEQQIQDTDSPKDRAYLLLLYRLSVAVEQNSKSVADLVTKFDAHVEAFEHHVEEEMAYINRGRGAWSVLAWVLGAVQTGVLAAVVWIGDIYGSLDSRVAEMEIYRAQHVVHHQMEEARARVTDVHP